MSLVCLSSANCLRLSCASSLEEASFWKTNLMQCAAYGLSTDRLTPTPSTSAAMLAALIHLFSKHNLWIWRWARAQLLWATMARPVLSGTCPVKLPYGLGHLAAAQFQGLGNLLIAYANGGDMEKIWYHNSFFRKITIHDFITILCHVGFTILLVVWAVQPN